MKSKCTWCLVGLLSLGGAALSLAQTSATEKAVTALEMKWLEAQKTNNADVIAPYLAEKFTFTDVDGKVSGKTAMLAYERATKFDSAEYEDLKVVVYGNTAIATGGFKAKGTDPSGKPFDEHLRWTDTWVKMSGNKWQCVASQSSPVTP